MKYYSPKNKGFYSDEIHGANRPFDCVELTNDMYTYLYEGLKAGYVISYVDKRFSLEERVITDEEILATKLAESKQYLSDTDFKMTVDYFATMTEAEQEDILSSRAAAREFVIANS